MSNYFKRVKEIELRKTEIRLAYIKSSVTFFLAIAGGLIALVKAFFPETEHKLWVVIAIVALVAAALFSLTIAEASVRRISEKPTWPPFKKLSNWMTDSADMDWVRSLIGAVAAAVALGSIIIFLFLSF